jgi:hypothetical protein
MELFHNYMKVEGDCEMFGFKKKNGGVSAHGLFKSLCIVLLLTVCLSFMGCAGKYGTIKPDGSITDSFEKFQIDPDMVYYLSGSDVFPTSILGLNKIYTLGTDLWKHVDMTPEIMNDLVTRMRTRLMLCCRQFQKGFVIVDDQGRKIGVWYSILGENIVVEIKEENKVIVHPPRDTRAYQEYEGRLGK